MNAATPYTPVLSRWFGLAYWLVRLAPAAVLVDTLCQTSSKRTDRPYVELLQVIAQACTPTGDAHGGLVRRAVVEAGFGSEDVTLTPDTITAAMEFAAAQVRRTGARAYDDGGWLRMGLSSSMPVADVSSNGMIGSRLLASTTDRRYIERTARVGVAFEEYLRSWSILLEVASAADSTSPAVLLEIQEACHAACQQFKRTVIRVEAENR